MENLTGGTPPVRYLPCVVPCKLYFIATYTILCFALPGAKMALGTTTLDRIWVAITCMALFKVVVSLVVAAIVGVLPMIVGKRE